MQNINKRIFIGAGEELGVKKNRFRFAWKFISKNKLIDKFEATIKMFINKNYPN